MNTVLKVNGMQCQHCVSHVKEALTKISGVSAEIDLGTKTATITHPESVSVADLKKAIEDAGYTVEQLKKLQRSTLDLVKEKKSAEA